MSSSAVVRSVPTATLAPVSSKERVEILDVLRGFALLGILWVNIDGSFRPPWETWYDHIIHRLDDLLANGRFFPQFSFLFGLGFALQMQRAEARGARFVSLYLRRMVILFLMGLAHFILIFDGDILRTYALMGLVLLLFRRCSPRTILLFATLAFCYCLFSGFVTERLAGIRSVNPQVSRPADPEIAVRQVDQQVRNEEEIWDKSQGTYSGIMAKRARQALSSLSRWQFYTDESMIWTLGLFLIGLYAGRRRIFEQPKAHISLLRRAMWFGLAAGLTLRLVWIAGWELADHNAFYFRSLNPQFLSRIGQIGAMFYVSAITLLFQKTSWQGRLKPLAWAGRMALTNYVLQSLVMSTIFHAYGLGLYVHASASLNLALVIVIYALQVLGSRWWLRRFQFGPLEWAWRTLTYGKLQPLNCPTAPTARS